MTAPHDDALRVIRAARADGINLFLKDGQLHGTAPGDEVGSHRPAIEAHYFDIIAVLKENPELGGDDRPPPPEEAKPDRAPEPEPEPKTVHYSRGRDKYDAYPVPHTAVSFEAFAEAVLSDRSTAKGLTWFAAPFKPNSDGRHHRCGDGALPREFIAFDLDGATPLGFAELCMMLGEFSGFGYTTSSHSAASPHARYILELSRPVDRTDGIRLGEAMQRQIEARLGPGAVQLDRSVYRAEQPIFTPLQNADVMRYQGDPIDVDAVLATAPPIDERPGLKERAAAIASRDPVVRALTERKMIKRKHGDGKLSIVCPFGSEHTEPGGESSTVYFLPNFGGVRYGKFVCKHTHCKERQQKDYLRALGLDPREVWRAQAGSAAPYDDLPPVECYDDAAQEDARRRTAIPSAGDEPRPGNGAADDSASREESRLRVVEIYVLSGNPPTQRARPQTDILIDIGLNVSKELFCGDDDRPYAVIRDAAEVWPVASRRVREWLRGCYFKHVGKGANSNSVRDAVETIAAKAQFSGDKRKVFLRTAEADGKLYIDLTDDAWRVVEIDRDGWRVLDQSPVMFTRRGSPAPLPVPERGGSLLDLWPLLNVPEKYRPLVAGWLLAALYPSGPYPILVLQGEEGTAKTTAALILRSLCDPAMVPLRPPTRDEKDFLVGAVGNWCICIDNMSDMQPWMSDALCRLSTGGGFAARTLYTDCDETAIQIQRPVILNGADVGAVRGDLISRTVTLTLCTIPDHQRQTPEELISAFEEARPRILGVLFTALAQAVREKPNVTLVQKPRMVGFAQLVVAAETALGFARGDFMAVYRENLADGVMGAIEASPVAQAIVTFMKDRQGWEGTATDLLKAITPSPDDRPRAVQATWPANSRGMSAALTRLAPALRRVGIWVERLERVGHERTRRLSLVYKVPAQPSAPSASVKPSCGAGLGADGSNHADDPTVRGQDQPSAPAQGNSQGSQGPISSADGADDADGPAGTLHTWGTRL